MNGDTPPLIQYDPSGVMIDGGLDQQSLAALADDLNEARRKVVEDDIDRFYNQPQKPDDPTLDAHFYLLPEKMLAEHDKVGEASEIARIQKTADRLSQAAQRMVVLGIGGSYMGARALMESCLPPYFNELDASARGGRPRMYFEGNNVDNDASAGLLRLLKESGDDWGIVVISKSGGTLETAIAFRQFFAALTEACGGDVAQAAQRTVPVTGASGKLFDLANSLGCTERYHVPDGVGGRFSVLSAVGLLPAALLGIDIVELLRGAEAMNNHFRTAGPGENVVLDYVGVCHLLETERQMPIRVLSVWSKALESVGLWYDQLLAESLGKDERGAMPLTVVNTRDLHSRAQQHQEGRRDKVMTNVIVENWRQPPLQVGQSEHNQDGLNRLADKTLPEVMTAAIEGTNQAYQEDGRPTADIRLPTLDAASIGQLLQMLMLATVVEGRLIDINPYGQPGVEKYKQHMSARL